MKTVLMVEDEPDFQAVVARILEPAGFRVETASSAEDAWARLADPARPVDLMLVDWNLPGEDGVSLCRRVRGDARIRTTPLVMLTVRNLPEEQLRGLTESCADLYLTKPIDPEELLARIESFLGYLS